MNELISSKEYVGNTVAISRNQEEQIFVNNGNSNYQVLASLMTYENIDYFAESISDYAGRLAVQGLYDKQYFEPKYGKFKNFFTRNIYLDPVKKQKMKYNREIVYDATRILTETAIKLGARGIEYERLKKKKYDSYFEVYEILELFSRLDADKSNMVLTDIELSKIIKSFDLDKKEKQKIYTNVKNKAVKSFRDIEGSFIFNADDAVLDNISYLLYSVAYAKYNDKELSDQRLLEYYRYLGYHEAMAKEILRENENTYNNVAKDQHIMLEISQKMIPQIFVSVPNINLEEIVRRGNEIAKYDPYKLRRDKVQSVAKGVASTGAKITIQMVMNRYPILSSLAASEALVQFQLSDNLKDEADKKLIEWTGGERKVVDAIIKNAEDIEKLI